MTKDGSEPGGLRGSSENAESYTEARTEARRRYGRFNLGIVGGTGVGKSSLVNAVFGEDRAPVGRGLPVTRGVNYYHDDLLGIWDFEGFEIGASRSPAETLRANLDTVARRPANEQIAVVWYCVTANADRLTRPDIQMIRELSVAALPVILVLTKVEWIRNHLTGAYRLPADVERFREWLEDPDDDSEPVDLPVQQVVPTSTRDRNGKGTGHGLGDLVEATLALSPDNAKDAFRIAQRLNLPWKREMARQVITAACAAAAAAAGVPIPIADAAVLAPIQMTMMARISVIYDLELKTMLSAQVLAQLSAEMAGRALARSFIKLIPIAGSVVNASVAPAITFATGDGWMRLCENVYTGKISPDQVADVASSFIPTLASALKGLHLPKEDRGRSKAKRGRSAR
jgi:uncharacterized protein (DUF697 family)/GTP-binding protein EngB required for normal cell division